MDAKHCRGCRDDYYNQGGNSIDGRCWSLDSAQLVTRFKTGVWTRPTEPGAFTQVKVPSCYRTKGYVFTDRLPDFVDVKNVIGYRRPRVRPAVRP